jgi:hypothetical protein
MDREVSMSLIYVAIITVVALCVGIYVGHTRAIDKCAVVMARDFYCVAKSTIPKVWRDKLASGRAKLAIADVKGAGLTVVKGGKDEV